MKICVISPFVDFISTEEKTKSATLTEKSTNKKDILNFIEENCHLYDFIILPGHQDNHPTVEEIKNILKDSKAVVFVEAGSFKDEKLGVDENRKSYLVSATDLIPMHQQIFTVSPTRSKLNALSLIWSGDNQSDGKRTHQIKGVNMSFFICGEINLFDDDANVRYGEVLLPIGEVIVNPTHTVMGRWGILGKKLSNLSRNGKVVIHVANNDCSPSNKKMDTDIRVYFNGEKMNIQKHRDFKEHFLTWITFDISKDKGKLLFSL